MCRFGIVAQVLEVFGCFAYLASACGFALHVGRDDDGSGARNPACMQQTEDSKAFLHQGIQFSSWVDLGLGLPGPQPTHC